MLDSGALFYTTAHRDVIKNCITRDNDKVYLANGEPLDIVGVGDVRLKMSNRQV